MKNEVLEDHGNSTYKMAWVVEIGLCSLAVCIAIFNLVSGLQNGNLMSAFLLGFGWLVCSVIELATIPLAGALRIARWRDKWIAFIGVIGLTFLSTWTVYEFNEFASYYMTQPARAALIEVDSYKAEKQSLSEQNAALLTNNNRVKLKRRAMSEDKLKAVNELGAQRKAALVSLEGERDKELDQISNKIKKLLSTVPLRAADLIKLQNNDTEVDRLQGEMSAAIHSVEKNMNTALALDAEAVRSVDNAYQEQANILQNIIERLNHQKSDELKHLVKGFLLERKKAKIRTYYDTLIKEQHDQLSRLNIQHSKSQITFNTSTYDNKLSTIKTAYKKRMDAIRVDSTSIRNAGLESSKELLRRRSEHAEALGEESLRVAAKYTAKISLAKAGFHKTKEELISGFDAKITAYTQATKTEAEIEGEFANNEMILKSLDASIKRTITETELSMEPVLYYRMAKWFSEADGLPTKDDYLRSQTHIFAPMGLFFGLVSIALAYIGIGLKSDAQLPSEQEKIIEHLKQKTKQFHSKSKRLSKLEGVTENQRLDIVKFKQEMFDVVKSIPQKIVLKMGI